MAGKIPVISAKALAEKHDCPIVLVFALDSTGEHFHVTTYGKTKALCSFAASLADQIAKKILDGTISP